MSLSDGMPKQRKNDEQFVSRLFGLLDAGPEVQRFPAADRDRKKRRVEEIVSAVCKDVDVEANTVKTQPVRPWVYGDFLERLHTFKASTWFAMPRELSPLQCARNGWTNSEPGMLKCVACGVELKFIEGTSVEEFQKSLSTKHESYCGWNENPCSESFCYFQNTSAAKIEENFQLRAQGFLRFLQGSNVQASELAAFLLTDFDYSGMAWHIEHPNGRLSCALPANISLGKSLFDSTSALAEAQTALDELNDGKPLSLPLQFAAKSASTEEPVTTFSRTESNSLPEIVGNNSVKILRNIAILIIFGWTLKELPCPENLEANTSGSSIVHNTELCCELCGRNFVVDTAVKGTPLNALQQHRFFCPWVATEAEAHATHRPGWELYLPRMFALNCNSNALAGAGSEAPVETEGIFAATAVLPARSDPSSLFKRIQSVMAALSSSPFSSSTTGASK